MYKLTQFIFIFLILSICKQGFTEELSLNGFPDETVIWQDRTIPVCWEDLAQSNPTQRSWVINAVTDTWQKHSLVKFVGWGQCNANSKGIRIKIIDDKNKGPHVKELGQKLNGVKNGMVLNFTYNNWSPGCRDEGQLAWCTSHIAVHEFGHALGFAHEQNRPDTNHEICPEHKIQGSDGTAIFGDWDAHSVMNYCNQNWNGFAQLSQTDIQMVRHYYGHPTQQAIPIKGDFNADNLTDIFMYIPGNGADFLWSAQGTGKFSVSENFDITGEYVPIIGKFSEPNRDDILWYARETLPDYLWLNFAGDQLQSSGNLGIDGIYQPFVADFTDNGLSEIVFYAPGEPHESMWHFSYGGAIRNQFYASFNKHPNARPLIGKFNHDRYPDIFWYTPGAVEDQLLLGLGGGNFLFWTQLPYRVDGTYVPLVGDFNGDSIDDIFWYGPGSAPDVLWSGSWDGNFNASNSLGVDAHYKPFVGDFDGDSISDIFWYAPGKNPDYIWFGSANNQFEFSDNLNVDGIYTPLTGKYITTVDNDNANQIFWLSSIANTSSIWTISQSRNVQTFNVTH